MNLSYSPDDLAFRDEIRTFIDENYPKRLREFADRDDMGKEDFLEWHRILGARGWSAPAWPTEHGGPGWSATQRYIFGEESARAQTIPVLPFGVMMVAPVIMAFGTQEQKDRYLPPILKGEEWWCQGYSEPGAGSDLASLKCKAAREIARAHV